MLSIFSYKDKKFNSYLNVTQIQIYSLYIFEIQTNFIWKKYIQKIIQQNKHGRSCFIYTTLLHHQVLDLKNAKSPTHPYSGENRLRIVGNLFVISNNVTTSTSFLASL